MPRVSVVIPTWDRARSFGRALDSVLAQTERDFEVIVIDDGSPGDAAERAVRERADPRIRYIKFPEHRGVSAARNAGVLAATGTYLAFLDDDDEWLPEKLQRQLETFERADDSVGAVYSARFTIDERTGQVTTTRSRQAFRPTDGNTVTTSSILIKRERLSAVGLFDEHFEAGEDYDMWIRLSERSRFVYIDVPLLKYYVHANSISNNVRKKRQSLERLLRKHASLFAAHRHDLAHAYTKLGVLHYNEGHLGRALVAFWNAVGACPLALHTYSVAVRTFLRARTVALMTRPSVGEAA
jgi:glycosyltransferase involved in cell wall biosynthesis